MERSADDQFSVGQLIGGTPYRVRGLIGSGGMGSVYEVEHIELGKRFVLKALRAQLLERSDLAARMKNEWRALGRLEHPNIVAVTDAGRTPAGVPYYVMERLEGETLSARLRRDGRLSLPLSLRLATGILDGLAAAHAIGIVHRDIKPQNIFLPTGGGVKLLDFGVAKLKDQAAMVVTRKGVAIGTPKYMSPEQAEGKPVDGRADIYAVGLVLFELLVGRGPFAHHKDPNDVVLAHMAEEPARLDRVSEVVPPHVADLVHRWLSKDPAERPLDAGEAARELRKLQSRFGFDLGSSPHDATLSADYEGATRASDGEPLAPAASEARAGAGAGDGLEDGAAELAAAELDAAELDAAGCGDSGELENRRSETPPPVVPQAEPEGDVLPWKRWGVLAAGAALCSFGALLLGGVLLAGPSSGGLPVHGPDGASTWPLPEGAGHEPSLRAGRALVPPERRAGSFELSVPPGDADGPVPAAPGEGLGGSAEGTPSEGSTSLGADPIPAGSSSPSTDSVQSRRDVERQAAAAAPSGPRRDGGTRAVQDGSTTAAASPKSAAQRAVSGSSPSNSSPPAAPTGAKSPAKSPAPLPDSGL